MGSSKIQVPRAHELEAALSAVGGSPAKVTLTFCGPTAPGVDPAHHPLAGGPRAPEDHPGDAAEAGGLP